MKKVLISLLIGVTLFSIGCGAKNEDKTSEQTTKEMVEVMEDDTTELNEELKEDKYINGNEEYVFTRPYGDWGIKFKATTRNTETNGHCVYIDYWLHNISFKGFTSYNINGSVMEYTDIVDFDITLDAKVTDSIGNILTSCGEGYGDEIISSVPVYIGETGHFANTYFIEDENALDNIIIKIELDTEKAEFLVPIEE